MRLVCQCCVCVYWALFVEWLCYVFLCALVFVVVCVCDCFVLCVLLVCFCCCVFVVLLRLVVSCFSFGLICWCAVILPGL